MVMSKKKIKEKEHKEKISFKKQVSEACADIKLFVSNNYRLAMPWIYTYLALSVISLLMTELGTGEYSHSFPKSLLLLFPRIISLFTITCACHLSSYRYPLFSILTGVWLVWMGIISGTPLHLIIGMLLTCLFVAIYLFYRTKKNSLISTNIDFFKKTIYWFLSFFILSLSIEIIHQFSIIKAFTHILGNPDMFFLNLATVMAIGMFVFICKKRNFAFALYSAFWVILAYISYLKYTNVNEPVLLLDVFQLNEALPAAMKILDPIDFILILVILVVLIVVVRLLSKKSKKVPFKMTNLLVILALYLVLPAPIIGAGNVGVIKTRERLLKNIFFHDGFVYSFINYSFKSGVTVPKGYNEDTIAELIKTIEERGKLTGELPDIQNLIVIQLESFADPYLFPESTYERDPIPFLHSLEEKYSTGSIDVPVFGGQTVKSEFEFITGLNLNLLPYGYSPYVQHIDKNMIDSFARYMKDIGYTPTAIHNYQGEFFSRHLVYGNLGFRRFIPYEMMPNVKKRPGFIWANDSVLKENIAQVLDSTEGKDFVFTVSVQLHSKYLVIDESEYPMEFDVKGDKELKSRIAYYVGQLEQFDAAIKSIVEYLEDRGEPTFLLLYADHLPSLFYDYDELSEDDKFTTKFFTWNNLGLEKEEDKHMELFYLSTYMCDMLGFEGNIVNKFHRAYKDEPDYLEKYELLQYHLMETDANDPKYKNNEYEIGGLNPFGINSIEFDDKENVITVKGEGFTDDTYLCINSKVYEAEYIDTNTLIVTNYTKTLSSKDAITVQVIGEKYGDMFKESEPYVYN